MFDYPIKIVQICLRKLTNTSLPVYKRKLFVTLIVLCTTEITLPFRVTNKERIILEDLKVNLPLSVAPLDYKKDSWLEFTSKNPLILLANHHVLNRGNCRQRYQLHYLIACIAKITFTPEMAAYLIYTRRNKGDVLFSQVIAKLSRIKPRGPPKTDLERIIRTSPKKTTSLICIPYPDFHTSTPIFIRENKKRLIINPCNLDPSLLLREGLFIINNSIDEGGDKRA